MTKNKGFILYEALIAMAVFGVLTVWILSAINYLQHRTVRSKYEMQAALLLQEGLEVGYNVFSVNGWDADWQSYSDSQNYFPAIAGNKWELIDGVEPPLEARFTRQIQFLCRDSAANIVACSQTEADKDSRVLKATISWKEEGKLYSYSSQLLLVKS